MSLGLEDSAGSVQAPSSGHEAGDHESGAGHHLLTRIFLVALVLYSLLPVFGIGLYSTASGDRCFELWYLVGFLIVAFFLMHEFITPLPPKKTE